MNLDKETRIYVTGCGGMLGQAVYDVFSERRCIVHATDIDVNEKWLHYMDIRQTEDIFRSIRSFKPHAILNLAAITDSEACERDPKDAWETNAASAENIGRIADIFDVPLVHISTSGVFDGTQFAYEDHDLPTPLGAYARAKAHAEEWIRKSVLKHYVVRAGWMMGGGPRKDKKFIGKIAKQLAAGARELSAVTDKTGSPTYTIDFARGLARLLESDKYGTYNSVCSGFASRYDMALAFVKALGLNVNVKPVTSAHFASEYVAPRPTSERLLTTNLDRHGLNVMRDWRTCLVEYAESFKRELPGDAI
jgi:dTDP-4-dehydrorhamnose reductase